MEQRVSLITLGVADIDRAAAFYDALGWERTESPDGVIAYDMVGQTLGLYSKRNLAKELGIEEKVGGFSGLTLAHNVRAKEDVGQALSDAKAAAAPIVKPAQDVFWGGHSGHFADPDGHIWEVAHNPFSPLRDGDGAFRWNGYGAP